MLPTNLLERRIRTINCGKPSPIHAGTVPENLLSPKSTNFNNLQFFEDGNSPLSVLLCRFNVSSSCSLPKEFGTSPKKLLLAKFKMYSWDQYEKQLGSRPDNRLFDRSMYHNMSSVILQTNKTDPKNRFLARFKIVSAIGKSGSGPSKRLSLKSITRAFKKFVDTFGNPPCIWFLERFNNISVGGKFANHSAGMVSEISALEISRTEMFLWVRIQFGNLGPKLQELNCIWSSWKGRTQLKLNSKARELLDKYKVHNLERLERFEKWASEIIPCKKIKETTKTTGLQYNLTWI